MMIVLLLVFILNIFINSSDGNHDDTYNIYLDRINDISVKQNNSIIYDIYDYPIMNTVDDNGIYSMIDIVTDNHHDIYTATKSNNNIVFGLLLPTSSSTHNDSKTLLLNSNVTMTSFRLISIDTKMYVIFIDSNKNKLSYTRLYYNNKEFSIHDDSIIYIDTHNSPDECKNLNGWVPVCNNNVNTTGHPGFGFICSIYPHRIVLFDKSLSSNNMMHLEINTLRMQQTMTVISHNSHAQFFIQLFWPYGHPLIPTTQPVLINTTMGQRYIVFFESSGKVMCQYANTYFFGVYLFDTVSPYGITHFSIDPIIPIKVYSKDNPWIEKRTNYMITPTGCISYNNTILVSLLSKKKSYIMKINKDNLVSSLRSVTCQSLQEMYVYQGVSGKVTPYYHHINFLIFHKFRPMQYKDIIKNEWRLKGNMRNPAMAKIYDDVVVINCLPYNFIRWGTILCQYKFHNASLFFKGFHEPSTENDAKLIGFSYNSTDIYEALFADDMRILNNDKVIWGIFNKVRPRGKNDPFHCDIYIVHLENKDKQLYVKGSVILTVIS
jgi:hypothetical protein